MNEFFAHLWSGPGKLIIIICVIYVIVGIPVTVMIMSKRKKKSVKFRKENKDFAEISIYTKMSSDELASNIKVHSVNGESPVWIGNTLKFYVPSGKNVILAEADWLETSFVSKGNTKTVRTEKISLEVAAKANGKYRLMYNRKEHRFIIEAL